MSVNSIHPGLVHTPMRKAVTAEIHDADSDAPRASPAAVSTFVVFLVRDESTYATGAKFVVDGGLTSYVPVKI